MDTSQFQQFMKLMEKMASNTSGYSSSAKTAGDLTLQWSRNQTQLTKTIADTQEQQKVLQLRTMELNQKYADLAKAAGGLLTKELQDQKDLEEELLKLESDRLQEKIKNATVESKLSREQWILKQQTKDLEDSFYESSQNQLKSLLNSKVDLSNLSEQEVLSLAAAGEGFSKLDKAAKDHLRTQLMSKGVTSDQVDKLFEYHEEARNFMRTQDESLKALEKTNESLKALEKTTVGKYYVEQIKEGKKGWDATKGVVKSIFEQDIYGFMKRYIKDLIDIQEQFVSATYRATGAINDHVVAINELNSRNQLGTKINQEAYKQVIESGIQYGNNREELVDLANTHVMASRVMGVNTQEVTNLTKALTASGITTQNVNNLYGKLATVQANYGVSTAKMAEIIKKTTEASADLMIKFGGAPEVLKNYASGLAAIQAAYGTQAKFAPFVAEGLTSLMEKMREATVLSGDLMASFAYMSGAGADPFEQFVGGVTEMVNTLGPERITEAFGASSNKMTGMAKAQRDAMRQAYTASFGLTEKEFASIAKMLEENNGNIDLAMNKIKEIQSQRAEDDALAKKAQESMETFGKQMDRIINMIKSSIGPVLKPILDVITKVVGMLAWVFEKVPGLGMVIGIGGLVMGAWAFARAIGAAFRKLTGISSILPGINSQLNAGAGGGPGGPGGGGFGGKLKGFLGGGLGLGKSLLVGGLASAGIGAIGGFISSSKKEEAEKLGTDTEEGKAALASAERTESATSGAATGAMIGSFLGPLGMAAGGLIGGVWGYFSKKSDQEEQKEKDRKAAEEARRAAETRQLEIAKRASEASSKDRFDRIAERRGISKEEAMLVASKRSGIDRKAASQARREAAEAARSARKQRLSEEASRSLSSAAATMGSAGIASVAIASQVSNSAMKETKAIASATTTATVAATAAIGANANSVIKGTEGIYKDQLDKTSIGMKMLMYSPLGLIGRSAMSIMEGGKSMVSETMGITRSFFSGIFNMNEKKEDEVKKAADRIIATLKEIHSNEKEESKSIKDILAAISENTEPRTSSSISTVWR